MFAVSIKTSFTASHQLVLPGGPKESRHSHDWLVTATVAADKLSEAGMVMDFGGLKALLDSIVAELDGAQLEQIEEFRSVNASAEVIAKCVYDRLRSKIPGPVELLSVEISEKKGCSAKFIK